MPCKKSSFINEKFANEYIEKLHKTSVRTIKPVRAYLCEECSTWHLTSVVSGEDRKMNNRIKMYERQIENLKRRVTHLEKENENIKKKKKC